MENIEVKEKHPELAYGLLPTFKKDNVMYGKLIVIKWGENGYFRTKYDNDDFTQEFVNELNEGLGVSESEADAMMTCSMCDNLKAHEWDKHYKLCLDLNKKH